MNSDKQLVFRSPSFVLRSLFTYPLSVAVIRNSGAITENGLANGELRTNDGERATRRSESRSSGWLVVSAPLEAVVVAPVAIAVFERADRRGDAPPHARHERRRAEQLGRIDERAVRCDQPCVDRQVHGDDTGTVSTTTSGVSKSTEAFA